ncbi:MAG: immunoglobulin-like domain-containing protein [Lachnospiraceae bacterium]
MARKIVKRIISLALVGAMILTDHISLCGLTPIETVQAETAETVIKIKPDAETFINGGSVDYNGNANSLILLGRKRYFLTRFDMSSIAEQVKANNQMVLKMELVSMIGDSDTNTATIHSMTDHSWAEAPAEATYRTVGGKWNSDVMDAQQGKGEGEELRLDVTGSYENLGLDTEYSTKLSYAVTGSGSDGYDDRITDEACISLVWDSTYLEVTLAPNTETYQNMRDYNSAKRAAAMIKGLYGGRTLYNDIILPKTAYGVDEIQWESSDETFLTNEGVVTRPDKTALDDEIITMQLTIIKGSQAYTDELKFIIAQEYPYIYPTTQGMVYYASGTVNNGISANTTLGEIADKNSAYGVHQQIFVGRSRIGIFEIPLEEVDEQASNIVFHLTGYGTSAATDVGIYVAELKDELAGQGEYPISEETGNTIYKETHYEWKKHNTGITMEIPKLNITNSVDLTEVFIEAKKAGKESLILVLHCEGDVAGALYSPLGDASRQIYILQENLPVEERFIQVAKDINQYDEDTFFTDFILPSYYGNGISVEWSSGNNDVIELVQKDDSLIARVHRPAADSALDAVVLLQAHLVYRYDTTQTKDIRININVPKEQKFVGNQGESFKNLITFARKTLAEETDYKPEAERVKPEVDEEGVAATAGDLGVLSKEAYDAFKQVVDEAEAETNPENYFSKMQRIIRYGYDYMNSGLQDNKIYKTKLKEYQLYLTEGNTLWYSQTRSMVRAYVWKAKACLLVEPELYPQSAKDVLQVQIDRAEKALAGTLHYEFSLNRQFNKAYDDQMLRKTLSEYVRINRFGREQWGILDATEWYRDQSILMDAYYSERLESNYEGTVQRNNAWRTDAGLLIGNYSFSFVQADLSNIKTEDIYSSAFEGYGTSDGGGFMELNDVPDYSMDEIKTFSSLLSSQHEAGKTLQIDDVEKNKKSLKIDFKPSGGGDNTLNITDTVLQRIEDGKSAVTIEFQPRDLVNVSSKYSGYERRADNLPYIRVTYRMVSTQQFKDKYEDFVGKQEQWLKDAKGYTGDISNANAGEYPQDKVDAAKAAMAALEQSYADNYPIGNYYPIAEAMIDLEDAVVDMRDHVALSTEIDPTSNFFFTVDEFEEVKERIKTDTDLKSFYEKNKSICDNAASWQEYKELYETLKEKDLASIKARDEKYRIWAGKGRLGFTAPKGTTQAYLTIELPSEENDAATDGYAGHVWVDDISLVATTVTDTVAVVNSGFEKGSGTKPMGWTFMGNGNAVGQWQTTNSNLALSGKCSLYLENPDANSHAIWQSDPFTMPPDSYSMSVNVKQHGKFKNGTIFTMHFLDADGRDLGSSEGFAVNDIGNIKDIDGKGVPSHNLLYQSATITYLLTDNMDYAYQAKYALLNYLNESCQGIRGWNIEHARPAYGDVYGAVQLGRMLNSMGTIIPILRQAGVFTEEEEALIARLGQFQIDSCSDMRDLTKVTEAEAAYDTTNWEFDMVHGSAMFAMAFSQSDAMPYAQRYIFNGTHFIKGQLLINMRDGVWPESVRYHGAFLGKMAVYARVCQKVMNKDFWTDPEFSLVDSFKYYVMIQTPAFANGNISTPTFGDHIFSSGDEFSWLGYYWDTIYQYDKELAAQVYETWVRAGRPSSETGSEDNMFQNFFGRGEFPGGTSAYKGSLNLTSNDFAKKYGNFIFRNNFGDTEKESYMAISMNPVEVGHSHPDQTAFVMYADSVPLVIDPGIGDYWGANKAALRSPASHAMVSYKNGVNTVRDSLGTTELNRWYVSDKMDTIKGTTGSSIGTDGSISRTINFVKDEFEAYIIWDQVSGATQGTRWALPVLTETPLSDTIDGNHVRADGFGDINLDVYILEGNTASYKLSSVIPQGKYPNRNGSKKPITDIIHIDNELNDNYLTVLFPQNERRGAITTSEVSLTNKNQKVKAYKITHSGGNSIYVVTNDSKVDETVTLGTPVQNLAEIDGEVSKDGVVAVPAYSMAILSTNVSVKNVNSNETTTSQNTGGGGGGIVLAPTESSASDDEINAGDSISTISVPNKKLVITKGGTCKFKIANLVDSDTVTYKSSNKKVAIVTKKGKVKAKKVGKALITATITRNGVTTTVSRIVKVRKPKAEKN